ncbi:MAG: glycosyltransferase family 39 protein [Pseudomonadales bacterium]|nr:glycosyltransferase family 39 protein [Pseudomonadales bacterium]
MKRLKALAPYVLIIILGFFLRAYRYTEFPTITETADEHAWTWLGASIIAEGQPTSWSYFHSYSDGPYVYAKSPLHAPFVRPALDHPPLFSFIPGAFHLLSGAKWSDLPEHSVIRIPMILLGSLAIALFGYWTSLVLEKRWSLFATFLFAVIPTFVFSSRVVVSENLLTIFFLVTAILIEKWENRLRGKTIQAKRQFKKIAVAFILVGVASMLTKISGIVVPATVLAYAVVKKDRYLGLFSVASIIIGALAVFSYAASINLQLFLDIQKEQSIRPIGLSTIYNRFFVKPNIAQKIYYDGWLIVGFFGFIYALIKKELTKNTHFWLFSLLAILSTLGFIGLSAGEFTFYGWYSYPLFPFFALCITLVLKEAYAKKYLLTAMLWILLLPGIETALSYASRDHFLTKPVIRLIYLIGFIPLLLSVTPLKKYARYTQLVLFACIICFGFVSVLAVDRTAVDAVSEHFIKGITE